MFCFDTSDKIPILNHYQAHDWADNADEACVITFTTTSGVRWIIHNLQWSYANPNDNTDNPSGNLLVTSGTTSIYSVDITRSGPGGYNLVLKSEIGEALTITLAAGGTNLVGKLNAQISSSFS